MKLIGLLVQELPKRGGWPKGYDVISTNGYGQIWCYKDDGGPLSGKELYIHSPEEGRVTREQYEAALAASQKVEWDGNYPIKSGTDVDVHFDGDDCWVWTTFRVEYMRGDVVVLHDYWTDDVGAYSNRILNFRPIRSEADKKRDEAIAAMQKRLGHAAGLVNVLNIYRAIEAGEIPHIRIE